MKMRKIACLAGALTLAAGLCGMNPALAAWPDDQPIKIVVPQAAGGTNDTVARIIAVSLGKSLGQSVVVENRPGASGAIGMQVVARSAPNGYTLAVASDTAAILSATQSLPWKLDRDLAGVAMIGDQPIGIAVPARSSYHTLADLLAAAKSRPGVLAFGSSGLGTDQHIVGEWLASLAGVQLIHVPYKGGGQAITDLIAGTVPAAVLGFSPLWVQQHSGNVHILAISAPSRTPVAPDIPTLKELGYDIDRTQWVGIVAPEKTPPAIVERLSAALGQILQDPQTIRHLRDEGLTARAMDSRQFDGFIKQNVSDWAGIVKKLNITLN